MHIGGGPNDDVTKSPIAQSIFLHFDALTACFTAAHLTAKVELGVDLHIPAAGHLAKVSHPRSTLPSQEFIDCAVAVYAKIDFLPPKTGETIVSYSVRITPKKL